MCFQGISPLKVQREKCGMKVQVLWKEVSKVPTDIKGVPDEQELLCGNNCEILFVQIPKIMFIGQIYPRERLGTAQLFVGVARNDVTVNL